MPNKNRFSFVPSSFRRWMAMLLLVIAGGTATAQTRPPKDNGCYIVTTADHLLWLAQAVNDDPYNTYDVRLDADIDLSGVEWTPIGKGSSFSDTPGFKWNFDGNGHTISNLKLPDTARSGFFGSLRGPAVVKNLTIDGVTSDVGDNARYIGALCGSASANGLLTISNCHVLNATVTSRQSASYTGGLIGMANGVSEGNNGVNIANCSFQGSVDKAYNCGGIVGYIYAYAVNLNNCTLLAGSKVGGNATYCGGICGRTNTRPSVCLNGCTIQSGCTIQNGSGDRPYGTYTEYEKPHLVDGVYQIANFNDLKWFRDYANDNDHSANARLVADIDMLNEEFNPIGDYGHNDSKIYRGTFDGDGHTLSNFHLKKWSENSGLVGYADNATIKNVNIRHVITPHSPNYEYEGAILGFGTNHTYVINCHVSDADIYYNVDCQGKYHGGIAGKIDVGSHIEGCTFQGKVGGGDRVGGIVGEVNSGAKVYNCILLTGSEVYGNDYIGGIGGIVNDKETKIDNCFVQQGVNVHSKSSSKYTGNIAGYTEYAPTSDAYDVRGLYYSLTGDITKSDNGSTKCYDVDVTGTVNGYTDNDYVVCTDMGVTYSYFTRHIKPKAFNQVDNLKTFSFIDYNHNTGAQRAYRWIDLDIDPQAFYYCYNFESMYMKYKMGGKNGFMVMLGPEDVHPADNAFEGCDKLKIYVDPEYYDDFVSHQLWSKYKDRLVSTTSMRTSEFDVSYVKYTRDNQKNSKGDYQTETASDGEKLYCVHVTGSGDLTECNGVARIYNDIGSSWSYKTTKIWAEAFRANNDLRGVAFFGAYSGKVHTPIKMTIGKRAFADCKQLRFIDLVYGNTNTSNYEAIDPDSVYPVDDTMIDGSQDVQIRVWPDLVDKFKSNAHWRAYADHIVAWRPDGAYESTDGSLYQYFLKDYSSRSLKPAPLVKFKSDAPEMAQKMAAILNETRDDFNYIDTKKLAEFNKESLAEDPYFHVAGANNKYLRENGGKLRIYNCLLSFSSKTTSIDQKAFLNNTYLKQVDFADYNTTVAIPISYPLYLAIQNDAFSGCTNLEYLDLIYYSYSGSIRDYLKPSQVVPARRIFGSDLSNIKTWIRVKPEWVDDFRNDPNWKDYADRIIPYNSTFGTTHSAKGLTYMESGVTYDAPDGVRCLETYVTGVDDKSRSDFTVYTNIGLTDAYRNVFIKSGAFKDNSSLSTLTFGDATTGSGHFWINMHIDDNAFENCPNFKALYMKYDMTSGQNHTIMLDPQDVYPKGNNAFENCRNLKIYVDSEKYDAFISDPNWKKYWKRIVGVTSMRSPELDESGVGYARDHVQDGSGSCQTAKSDDGTDVYYVHVTGPGNGLSSSCNGVATIYNNPGMSYACRTTKIWAEAYMGNSELRTVRFLEAYTDKAHMPLNMTIGQRAFANCPNLQYIEMVYGNGKTSKYEPITPTQIYPVDDTMLQSSPNALIRVWPDQVEAFKKDPHWAPYAERIVPWTAHDSDESATLTVNMDQAGTLAEKLGLTLAESKMTVASGDYSKYKKLKIAGPVNPIDLNTLAILAGQTRHATSDEADASVVESDEYTQAQEKGLDTDEFFGPNATDVIMGATPQNSHLWYIDLSDATFVNLDGKARADFVLPRRAFKDCDVLETIILPKTMRKLTVEALAYADNLKQVVLGDNTTTVEENALTTCPKLEKLTTMRADLNLSGGNQLSGNTATSPFATGYQLPALCCSKEDSTALTDNPAIQGFCKDIVIAFHDKALMRLMRTHEIFSEEDMYQLKSIGLMFQGNSDIKDLTALRFCLQLTAIDDKAFANMANLKSIALPANVKTAGKSLFSGCDNLLYIDWQNAEQEIISSVSRTDPDSPLNGTSVHTLVYAPVEIDGIDDDDVNIISTVAGEGEWFTHKFLADDNYEVYIPYGFYTAKAAISRSFKPDVKSTVYLPFDIDDDNVNKLGKFYEFDSYDSSTGSVKFRRVWYAEAGKGYLFLPDWTNLSVEPWEEYEVIDVMPTTADNADNADTQPDGMYGTWQRKTWTTVTGNDYGFSAVSDGNVSEGQFARMEVGAWMRPMRAWLHLNNEASIKPQRLALLIDGDEPTGIVDINADEQPATVSVYTTDGKLVRHNVAPTECLKGLPKGIYVVNGKKVYCE